MALGAVGFHPEPSDGFDPALIPLAQFLLRLRQRGITDRAVIDAFEALPRRKFLPGEARFSSHFSDRPLPIDCGQLTTPPEIVARIHAAIRPTSETRILDIGTGTGYLAAFLARFAKRVYTVERFRTLVQAAQLRFQALGIDNVSAAFGDGLLGWPERAPFNAIVTLASSETVPRPLIEQLQPGGILVMPIGPEDGIQSLMRFEKIGGRLDGASLGPVRLPPLIEGRAAVL